MLSSTPLPAVLQVWTLRTVRDISLLHGSVLVSVQQINYITCRSLTLTVRRF